MDLLVDAIKEMVSQFIIDMMELITGVFTDLLSCNLPVLCIWFQATGKLCIKNCRDSVSVGNCN